MFKQNKTMIMSFRLSKPLKTVQLFTTVRDLASCNVQPPNQTRQALAPSALMLLCSKLMLVIELLTFKTSANAWQKQQRRPSRFNQAWTPETGSGGISLRESKQMSKPRTRDVIQPFNIFHPNFHPLSPRGMTDQVKTPPIFILRRMA